MKNYMLILLLVLPVIICTFTPANKYSAYAGDAAEDDLVDVDGDTEGDIDTDSETEDGAVTGEDAEPEEETDSTATSSPNADTHLLFTQPLYTVGQQLDLPGGKPVEFLIGFTNKGQNDFVIESVEASFRYPMDFNYHIQNFSAVTYNRKVSPGLEATVAYSFVPSDQFAGRPFGLNIALNYRDSHGVGFNEAVFNETVLISEVDEGLDGETFFLYVLLAGIVVLLLVIGQQYLLGSSGKRKRAAAKKTIETGTANDSNIDYEWLPQETLRVLQQSSPKPTKAGKTSPRPNSKPSSPKQSQSPKQRKVKRSAGDD